VSEGALVVGEGPIEVSLQIGINCTHSQENDSMGSEEPAGWKVDFSALRSYEFLTLAKFFEGNPIGGHDGFWAWRTWYCIDWFKMLQGKEDLKRGEEKLLLT
jgi:hypothetical protein